MNNETVLGRIIDHDVDNDSQEELNAESLFIYDSMQFVDLLGTRMSKYDVEFYLDNLVEENEEIYWEEVLKKLINIYSFYPLKVYLEKGFRFLEFDFKTEVIKLIRIIKVDIPFIIEDKDIKRKDVDTITKMKIVFEKYKITLPFMMEYFFEYTDNESFTNFLNKIFSEQEDLV